MFTRGEFMQIIKLFLAVVVGYVIGSIPWALIIGKVFYKTDIRQHGSGNLGGTNAGRVLGKKAGIAVILLDVLKAFLVVFFFSKVSVDAAVLCGLSVCVGHCFPIFADFKGGKAVATTFGYLLAISLFITHEFAFMFLVPISIFLATLAITKYVSFASIIGISSSIFTSFYIQKNILISYSLLIIAIFVIYRHKDNVVRILKGNEKKITWLK